MSSTPAELVEIFKRVDPAFEPNVVLDTEDQVYDAFRAFMCPTEDRIVELNLPKKSKKSKKK